jgi:hypothetical protein
MQMEDWSCMYESGDVLAHFKEVSVFLDAIVEHASRQKEDELYCPSKVCNNNVVYRDRELICEHLVRRGFMNNYIIWRKHVEIQSMIESIIDERAEENINILDHVCSHRRSLWITLELLKLKASNRWIDTSFSARLKLLSKVLSKPNGLPTSTYQAKNFICPLTLGIETIHACPNHCILYRKEHEFKEKCPTCNASWYKQNDNSEEVEEDLCNKRQG